MGIAIDSESQEFSPIRKDKVYRFFVPDNDLEQGVRVSVKV
jgi:hypothetical protein